jgi:DNA-binding response OmpR family regulator
VEAADNGQSGIDMALELIPDIVITDVMMPKKNGYEVTHALKNDPRTSHIPIIILTAKATEMDKLHGLQSGADAYLKKPFNKAELLVRIVNLLQLKKRIQESYSLPKIKRPANSKATTNVLLKEKTDLQSLDDQFIQGLHLEIEKRLDDTSLTISDLCTATGLSHSQLYRKLKALTDQTPVHFIRTYRLHKAETFLRDGKYNVSEVAYMVGFNDPNYFSRTYIQEFGQPPSEVRANADK